MTTTHTSQEVAMTGRGEAAESLTLMRDPHGELILVTADGQRVPVVPVRNFPLSSPEDGLSLTGPDGRERLWIASLSALPRDERHLIQEALNQRDFTPVISRIQRVSSYATPSRWQVQTDRGPTTVQLNGEEDIRRLPGGGLLITDACGLSFLIRDMAGLDRHSRRVLDHFL